jgi:hypothetical protein
VALVLGVAGVGALGMLFFARSREESDVELAMAPETPAAASSPVVPSLPVPKKPTPAEVPSVAKPPGITNQGSRKEPKAAQAKPVPKAGAAPEATPSPAPAEEPREPEPPPPPKPASPGTVVVRGDVAGVTLVGTDGVKRGAGKVPEGTYTAQVRFAEGIVIRGIVNVRAGETSTITCSAQMQRCGGWAGSL